MQYAERLSGLQQDSQVVSFVTMCCHSTLPLSISKNKSFLYLLCMTVRKKVKSTFHDIRNIHIVMLKVERTLKAG